MLCTGVSNVVTDVGPGHGVDLASNGLPEVREEGSAVVIVGGVLAQGAGQESNLSTASISYLPVSIMTAFLLEDRL